jgi:hypothetical protein
MSKPTQAKIQGAVKTLVSTCSAAITVCILVLGAYVLGTSMQTKITIIVERKPAVHVSDAGEEEAGIRINGPRPQNKPPAL